MTVLHGDCREMMRTLDANSVDAVVTDPPYGLAFMGKGWDHAVPGIEFWTEALRVAKPGAHLVAFGGTRTYHRLACAIEDAGWEVRDCLSWLYGSGFPKSHNGPWGGTALKPAWEPIIPARKPLDGTVAANVAAHGTGAINVDGCRIAGEKGDGVWGDEQNPERHASFPGSDGQTMGGGWNAPGVSRPRSLPGGMVGRWPANVCLDEDAAAQLGEPSRFFYVAKASRREREAGLEGMQQRSVMRYSEKAQGPLPQQTPRKPVLQANHHPTVKPIALMRWLCRLVTPSGGLVLDPFMGSGTTGCAAVLEGFRFVGCEREAEYVAIAEARIAHWSEQTVLTTELESVSV